MPLGLCHNGHTLFKLMMHVFIWFYHRCISYEIKVGIFSSIPYDKLGIHSLTITLWLFLVVISVNRFLSNYLVLSCMNFILPFPYVLFYLGRGFDRLVFSIVYTISIEQTNYDVKFEFRKRFHWWCCCCVVLCYVLFGVVHKKYWCRTGIRFDEQVSGFKHNQSDF